VEPPGVSITASPGVPPDCTGAAAGTTTFGAGVEGGSVGTAGGSVGTTGGGTGNSAGAWAGSGSTLPASSPIPTDDMAEASDVKYSWARRGDLSWYKNYLFIYCIYIYVFIFIFIRI